MGLPGDHRGLIRGEVGDCGADLMRLDKASERHPGKRGGDKRTVVIREVVNGLMYILSTGCQWRAIPKDLPPRSTVYDYFDLWSWDGTLDRIHHELHAKCREAVSREVTPTAAAIDSQSVKSAEKGRVRLTRPIMARERRSRAQQLLNATDARNANRTPLLVSTSAAVS